MPTSVLLAVLAAAGLLALAPALTRRHDGTERLAAERATSTARVLTRRRRRRTVPGPRPVNPPRPVRVYRSGTAVRLGTAGAGRGMPGLDRGDRRGGVGGTSMGAGGRSSAGTGGGRGGAAAAGGRQVAAGRSSGDWSAARRKAPPAAAASRASRSGSRSRRSASRSRGRVGAEARSVRRRRRVFLALILFTLAGLAGVALGGPGFWATVWIGSGLLMADLVYLRRRAVRAARLRHARARTRTPITAHQPVVRWEPGQGAAQRRAGAGRTAGDHEP